LKKRRIAKAGNCEALEEKPYLGGPSQERKYLKEKKATHHCAREKRGDLRDEKALMGKAIKQPEEVSFSNPDYPTSARVHLFEGE